MRTISKIGRPAGQRPVTILLVEDNPGDEILLRQALEVSKFTVHMEVVSDGEKAIDYLRRRNPYFSSPRPDLILLDLNLPRKNGHEVAAEIKRSSRLSGIPTLILTSSNQDDDKWLAYHRNVDAYLLKPRELSHYENLLNYLEENWFKDILQDGFSAP